MGILAAGCSMTVDVVGFVGNETFKGKSTGYGDGTGYMEMENATGTKCVGDFVFHGSRAGTAILSCNDGRQAALQFRSVRTGAGYGFGTLNTGGNVQFYYGMSDAEGATVATRPGTSPAPGGGGGGTKKNGTGTGFYVTRQGHILTNAHVVNGCKTITVQQPGGATASATAVATDKQNDLALLQASSSVPAVATLRAGRPIRPGEAVVAYGFPLSGIMASGGVLTTGTVNALAGPGDDSRFLQVSAPVQPGNSGGPLLDVTGAVVGITSKSISTNNAARALGATPQNVNYAIKTDVVRTFLSTTGVSAESSAGGRELNAADVGDRARAFTVHVECKG